MSATGIVATCAPFVVAPDSGSTAAVAGLCGSRADKPLPKALRCCLSGIVFTCQDLLCQLNVTFGAAGAHIVRQNWLAIARCFREPDASGNYCLKYRLLKEVSKVRLHLPR